MPWGFRRSLKLAGPLRLNLSKSGLGLSLGVPGLHIGSGPRGQYLRAGVPGTGVYYRKSLNKPRPHHVAEPAAKECESGWMMAVHALLDGHPDECLRLLDAATDLGPGPAVHIEVDEDVIVTLAPDACGLAVLRAEALDRLGRHDEALAAAETVAGRCHVAEIVAEELRRGQ